MHSIIYGVLIYMLEPGIKEDTSAILRSKYNNKFKNIPKNLASGIKKIEIKYMIKPKIVAISMIGAAKIFEIQNVNDTVLKLYAMIGIIIKFAERVILKDMIMYFIILLIIFLFLFSSL